MADRAWTCWTGACPACPTAGSPATTSSAGPPSSARRCGGGSERYVLDVPCNTTVRDLERRRPPRQQAGVGRKREVPFQRADDWAASQPESRWERITVRDGEKGPLVVDAMTVRVRAKQDGRIGPEERLVVIRPVGESRIDYALTNAGPEVPLTALSHGVSPIADSFSRNSSGVSLRNSQKLRSGNFRPSRPYGV